MELRTEPCCVPPETPALQLVLNLPEAFLTPPVFLHRVLELREILPQAFLYIPSLEEPPPRLPTQWVSAEVGKCFLYRTRE